MQTFWQDLRYGARMLMKEPGFTLASVIALALGIGANIAIFSVMMTVLVRPLPFNEPESLGVIHGYFTEDDILAFREQAITCAQIVVGYSCKRRRACPSCSARRMCRTAAHLVKHVPLADAPLRQWGG